MKKLEHTVYQLQNILERLGTLIILLPSAYVSYYTYKFSFLTKSTNYKEIKKHESPNLVNDDCVLWEVLPGNGTLICSK